MAHPTETSGSGDFELALPSDQSIAFSKAGGIEGLSLPGYSLDASLVGPLTIEIGGKQVVLDDPIDTQARPFGRTFVYRVTDTMTATVEYEASFPDLPDSGFTLTIGTSISVLSPVARSVAVRIPVNISASGRSVVSAPLHDGRLLSMDSADSRRRHGHPYLGSHGLPSFVWRMAGDVRTYIGLSTRTLGAPLVTQLFVDSGFRATWSTDPFFTSCFQLPEAANGASGAGEINWRYVEPVGVQDHESRKVSITIHRGEVHDAFSSMYATSLEDIPAGPEWLHEIELVHYDYLADHGRAWFRDISALAEATPAEDRQRLLPVIHGWYDILGKYSMCAADDLATDWESLVFRTPNPDSPSQDVERVAMDPARVREMARHAKNLGMRVALYFGDGLVADSQWAESAFDEGDILRCGGWEAGPGHAVLLNPSSPAVRDHFHRYLATLLSHFGEVIDALIWDETYYIGAGEFGPSDKPGYVDRDFMTLMRDLAAQCHEFSPGLAFMGSDNLGVGGHVDADRNPSYSIVVDGLFQDSGCGPEGWAHALAPNRRNVIWSCNWMPWQNRALTELGTQRFATPVSTSNGYLENRGPADVPLDELRSLVALGAEGRGRRLSSAAWVGDDEPALLGLAGESYDL